MKIRKVLFFQFISLARRRRENSVEIHFHSRKFVFIIQNIFFLIKTFNSYQQQRDLNNLLISRFIKSREEIVAIGFYDFSALNTESIS